MSIRRLFFILCLSFSLALSVSCGDDGGDDGDNNTSSSSSETCSSSHECVNGACECTTSGKEGDACTDDDACEDECEVCAEE
ncbi:MAG: hypothetical protein ACLFVJ_17115 [Persicimonas sp.]